jgi:pimeloyl-ACP methyl ester carboxylesterase
VAAAALIPTLAGAQPPPAPPAAASSFTVFLRGVPIGSEQIAVSRGAGGWTITSSGRMGAPIDIVARRVEVRYTEDWKPIELVVDATLRGQPLSIQTNVTGTTAQTHFVSGGRSQDKTDTIPADPVLLPSPFWGPFEALSLRLKTAAAGSTIPGYIPPASLTIRVGESNDEHIQTVVRLIDARRTRVTLMTSSLPLDAEVWADETGRLLRLTIPAQNIDVVRDDVASVAARRVTISRPNDEPVKMPANGFSLAGTISKPTTATAKALPAIVLVAGSGPTDRDETVFNVPIFGQVAGALADAGFIVLRYDKRGIGQSGGRAEAATLADYADDLRAAVKFMTDRKDVDGKHVAVAGHSEGGSVAMLAAAKDKRIAALVLIAALGVTGAELNLEQVTHALDRSKKTDAEKQSTIALQKKIQAAVLTGKGWEEIPLALRKQAETAWFQSFLAFDPGKVMPEARQPILIVQGMLDTQVTSANADRLEALARARKNAPPVEVVKMPGINHLLLPATTGEFDEYSSLSDQRVSPAIAAAIASWLRKTFATPAK